MKVLRVYDPPMCCSTGVCGPEVDPALARFSADLKWVEWHGVTVERYNLAQSPMAFVKEESVRSRLTEQGEAALPLVMVGDSVMSSGAYPSRHELADFLDLNDANSGIRELKGKTSDYA